MRKLLSDIKFGWGIQHDKGTAFVSMRHPAGGAYSLVEVKTYGSPLTLDEADALAGRIAEFLQAEVENAKSAD